MPRAMVVLFLILLPLAAAAQPPGTYAISGGTVHPVNGPPIENGVVVIRDGLIAAVGAGLSPPADATVLDATGLHVYPGLFDAYTALGLPAAPAAPGDPYDLGSAGDTPPEATASVEAADLIRIDPEAADAKRATGVTTVMSAPASGIFGGQSAILNLGEGDLHTLLIRTPASFQLSFNPRRGGVYPASLMGVISFARQTFLDARQHATATSIYSDDPAGRRRPAPNADLAALAPVMARELPIVIAADDELMMRRARAIAGEFRLRWILAGASDSYAMSDTIAGWQVPVLFSVDFPRPPSKQEDRADQPLRVIRDRVLGPTGPAELSRRNVPFALVSGPRAKGGALMEGVRKVIDAGLTKEAALEALTLAPARIFGVDRQLGSLERGKIANVVVTAGEIFDEESEVRHLLVDGRLMRLPEKKEEAEAPSPTEGAWDLSIRAAEGILAIRIQLDVDGELVSGTYSGDLGSGDIGNGSIEGNTIRFVLHHTASSGTETSDWRFEGTVEGDTMTGTVDTTVGQYEFSGSRPQ